MQTVANHTEVIILQHPKEATHAKNTVRLLSLALKTFTLYTGKSGADFTALRKQLSESTKRTAVLYPSPESIELPVLQGKDDQRI